jgi:hypothetical protein
MAATTLTGVRFEDLKPGDRITITHRVKVGLKIWYTKTKGIVERTDRRRNGLHIERSNDDWVFQDIIVMKTDEKVPTETTVAMDEFTIIERA